MALEEVEQLRSQPSDSGDSEKHHDEDPTQLDKNEKEQDQEPEQEHDHEQEEQDRQVERKAEETKDVKKDRWALAKRVWAKTNLDVTTMKIMAKGALAPTIALAAYQSTPFADVFTTIGYLVGIVSILSFAIMPRAKVCILLQTRILLPF